MIGRPVRSSAQADAPSPVHPAVPACSERAAGVLAEILDLPEPERGAKLAQLADETLRGEVVRLLAFAEAADRAGFLADDPPDLADPPAPGPEAARPERIGPYRVLGRLGEGGSGVVYLAESAAPLFRRVAVKVSRASLSGDAASRAAIEAEALAALNHHGIAQVFDTGVLDDGRRWTACELVEGERINEAAAGLNWRQRVELLLQAADALHHAHQRGVIHRDLKPSNLLVVAGRGEPSLKMIDFGVARLIRPRGVTGPVTETGLLVGTLAYMAPEQLAGRNADARADVYGLGLVACEVLTGKPPPGRSGGLTQITRASQSPVRVRLSDCAGRERDLEAIIAKATEPGPAARYPSAQHLAEDLRRVLDREPVLARRAGVVRRLRLYAARHPSQTAAGLAVGAVIAALVTALAVSRARLSTELADQRSLFNELVTDSLEGLREVRGTREQRLAMIGALLDRVSRRLAHNPDDPDLRALQARLLRERGDIAGALGHHDQAMADLARSHRLYEALTSEGFGGPAMGRLHAESLIRLGDVRLEREGGTAVKAVMKLYCDAMAIQGALLRDHPHDVALRDDYCWSYDRVSGVADNWSLFTEDEVEAWLHRRIRAGEELLRDTPGRPLSLYNLAIGHLRHAKFLGLRARHEESERAVEIGLAYIRDAVRAEPHRAAFVQGHMDLLYWQVRTLLELERHDDAASAAALFVAVAREQARLLPHDVMTETSFFNALDQAAGACVRMGRRAEARAYAEEALGRLNVVRSVVQAASLPGYDHAEARLRAWARAE